jgi:methylglutamate dehydrogenase subunit B
VTRLACPFCGPRDLREFEFHKTLPEAGAASDFERTYERMADSRRSLEHWQHVGGCRAWLLLDRDPSTGAVRELRLLGGGQP